MQDGQIYKIIQKYHTHAFQSNNSVDAVLQNSEVMREEKEKKKIIGA